MKDLLFYLADRDMAEAVAGLLERDQVHEIIGCRRFDFDSRRDIKVSNGQKDSGVYTRANELLRPMVREYRHAVVIIDEAWDGSPGAEKIEARLRKHLVEVGWSEHAVLALAVRPEADVWLWSDSLHSAKALGWPSWEELRSALEHAGWLDAGRRKPEQPKEAAEWALRNGERKRRRSPALYRQVAAKVSVKRCEDAALERLLTTLRVWFPVVGT